MFLHSQNQRKLSPKAGFGGAFGHVSQSIHVETQYYSTTEEKNNVPSTTNEKSQPITRVDQ
jgi:hypothetical protein